MKKKGFGAEPGARFVRGKQRLDRGICEKEEGIWKSVAFRGEKKNRMGVAVVDSQVDVRKGGGKKLRRKCLCGWRGW